MNKPIIFISFVIAIVLIHFGLSAKAQVVDLNIENSQLLADNSNMNQEIKDKELLARRLPVPMRIEYALVLNQIRLLESYSGTSMNVELEAAKDTQDVSSHYVGTEYKGIKGLKIKIIINKFSNETDIGAVLDDIHLLEKNTDFISSEITKDKNSLIVKGEVYGL